MEHKRFTFSKSEKLCNKNQISKLFKGKSCFAFPLKVGYSFEEGECGVKVVCSVGKRYNKRAVARNLMKRRIREAYRLNKYSLLDPLLAQKSSIQVNIAFIFVAKEEQSYLTIAKSIDYALKQIAKELDNSSSTASDFSL